MLGGEGAPFLAQGELAALWCGGRGGGGDEGDGDEDDGEEKRGCAHGGGTGEEQEQEDQGMMGQ